MSAPIARPFPYEAGNPANHGFARCSRCGTQRPAVGLVMVGDAPAVCADRSWCDLQAGKPTGLDTNGDAVKP